MCVCVCVCVCVLLGWQISNFQKVYKYFSTIVEHSCEQQLCSATSSETAIHYCEVSVMCIGWFGDCDKLKATIVRHFIGYTNN